MSTGPKKGATSTAAKADDLVQFTKAVEALHKAITKQQEMHESLAEFAPDKLQEWQSKLEAAKRAHETGVDEMEQDAKRRRVNHELDVKAGGLEVAKQLLAAEEHTAVRTKEWEDMKTRLKAAEEKVTTIQGDTEDRVEKALNKDHTSAIEKQDLIHKAEMAKLKEQNELLKSQLTEKDSTIKGLREDVKSTQQLVSAFASQPKYEVHHSGSSRGDK